MSFKKYEQYPIVKNFKREWADKTITKAPIYCSKEESDRLKRELKKEEIIEFYKK